MSECSFEVARGERYEFGKNWQRFLATLNEEKIREAENSLRQMLRVSDLAGKTFLDIGSGSGLFSLAAMRLGAARVHSFDYDPRSVGCTGELKRRYFPGADNWTVEEASVLDRQYLSKLPEFDVVYSWGVLHHTGNMWQALENVSGLVREGGLLFIAIYNDQGRASQIWKGVKILYNRSLLCRLLITPAFVLLMLAHGLALDAIALKNPIARYRQYGKRRGMSLMPDILDWLGGYPFEVASAERIAVFYSARGFRLTNSTLSKNGKGRGNNQYVFSRAGAEDGSTARISLDGVQPAREPVHGPAVLKTS